MSDTASTPSTPTQIDEGAAHDAYCTECGTYLDGAVYTSPLTEGPVCYDCYSDLMDEEDDDA
jgi:hypothetical protein